MHWQSATHSPLRTPPSPSQLHPAQPVGVLAAGVHQRRPAAVLLLLRGPPGAGKSTLAAALAPALRWPLVSKDDARGPMHAVAIAHPGIDWNELSYAVMFRVIDAQLRVGLSVVVDCPLARRSLFDRAEALAAQHGAEIALVELEPCDRDLWRQRVEQRGRLERGTLDAHKPGTWAEVLERIGNESCWSDGVSVAMRCRIDSTAAGVAVQDHVERVLRMLQSGGRQREQGEQRHHSGGDDGGGGEESVRPRALD